MNKTKIYRYLALFFVAFETLTIIRGYVVVRDWLPMSLIVAITLFLYPRANFNRETLFLLLYCVIGSSLILTKYEYQFLRLLSIESLTMLSCLVIINALIYNNDYYGIKIIAFIGVIIVFITSILSIPILFKDLSAARNIVIYMAEGEIEKLNSLYQKGMASYGLIHSVSLICPIIICQIKTNKSKLLKIFYSMVLFTSYIMVLKASFGVALILTTLSILLSIIVTRNKIINIFLVAFIIISSMVFINKQVIGFSLMSIRPFFAGTAIESKINDIIESIDRGSSTNQVKSRSDLYSKSLKGFLDNPIYGNLDRKDVGGHSYLLDRLSFYGIIGFIPLALFYFSIFWKHYLLIDRSKRSYYLIGVVLFAILATVKNSGQIETFLFLFIFLIGMGINNKLNSYGKKIL